MAELEGLLQESRLGNSKLTQETKFLEGELDGLSKELETCRGQLAEAQDRVKELEEESKDLKHVEAERRIEVERLTAVIKVTNNESHKMQLENRQLVEDTTRLKHELEAQVRECNDNKQDARAAKAEVEQLNFFHLRVSDQGPFLGAGFWLHHLGTAMRVSLTNARVFLCNCIISAFERGVFGQRYTDYGVVCCVLIT